MEKRVECLATSNAFEKSRARTWTKGSVAKWEVTVYTRDTTAAVVEPEGRKAC